MTDDQLVSTLLDLQRGTTAEKVAFIWTFVATSEDEITRSQLAELIKVLPGLIANNPSPPPPATIPAHSPTHIPPPSLTLCDRFC